MVHGIVIILLFGLLAVSMSFFVVMGLRQHRRTNALARAAHGAGMQFAPEDLFDVPRRYAGFALIGAGHSPRAHNMTYGRLGGRPIRMFDFRYEIGHGTRRLARHYGVVVAEGAADLPDLLMWHAEDAPLVPLPARQAPRRVARWTCVGDTAAAEKVADTCRPLGDRLASIQARDGSVMVCVPVQRGRRAYAVTPSDAAAVLGVLASAGPADPDGAPLQTPP